MLYKRHFPQKSESILLKKGIHTTMLLRRDPSVSNMVEVSENGAIDAELGTVSWECRVIDSLVTWYRRVDRPLTRRSSESGERVSEERVRAWWAVGVN